MDLPGLATIDTRNGAKSRYNLHEHEYGYPDSNEWNTLNTST